jgi:hypothetical protein
MTNPATAYPTAVNCTFTQDEAIRLRRYAEDEDLSIRAAVRKFVKAGLELNPQGIARGPHRVFDSPVEIVCTFTADQGAELKYYADANGLKLRAAVRRFVRLGLTVHYGLPDVAEHPEQQSLPVPREDTTPDD